MCIGPIMHVHASDASSLTDLLDPFSPSLAAVVWMAGSLVTALSSSS